MPRWTSGLRCGPSHQPDMYELLDHCRTGGEGETWEARRLDRNGDADRCAVKIFTRAEGDATQWVNRWDDSRHRAARLRVSGLVVPVDCFVGQEPHPLGRRGGGSVPYLVTEWIDADSIGTWAERSGADAAERMAAIVRLSMIVDALHEKSWTHRDISAGNVLVSADGQVHLIDLTFMAPLNRPLTVVAHTPGFAAAGSEREGEPPSEAKDRYGVGALARMLLLPDARSLPAHEASQIARRELVEAGYSAETAEWLIRPLLPHPERQPRPLADWARRLRELVESDRRGRSCLALFTDLRGKPAMLTGDPMGVTSHQVAGSEPDGEPLPPSAGSPRGVRALAVVRASGQVVATALDGRGRVWAGTAKGWSQIAQSAHSLATLASARGEVLVWSGHDDHIRLQRWRPVEKSWEVVHRLPLATRVVAAAMDARGCPAVLTADDDRLIQWTWPVDPHVAPEGIPVCASDVTRAALGVGEWGELEAATVSGNGLEWWVRHFSGAWDRSPATSPSRHVTGISITGIRGGLAAALAGPDGVEVVFSPGIGTPETLCQEPSDQVSIVQTPNGRLAVGALVDGSPRCWEESWDGHWFRGG